MKAVQTRCLQEAFVVSRFIDSGLKCVDPVTTPKRLVFDWGGAMARVFGRYANVFCVDHVGACWAAGPLSYVAW